MPLAHASDWGDSVPSERKCSGQNGPLISIAPIETSWIANSQRSAALIAPP